MSRDRLSRQVAYTAFGLGLLALGGVAGSPDRDTDAPLTTARFAPLAGLDLERPAPRVNRLVSTAEWADPEASLLPGRGTRTAAAPVRGTISSPFVEARRHPRLGGVRPHTGVDIAAPAGTPILAPAAGRVTFSGPATGYGRLVVIDHGRGVTTRYAHCTRTLVAAGQHVGPGQPIALVGSAGLSTGPHLHYEVRVDERPVDPLAHRW